MKNHLKAGTLLTIQKKSYESLNLKKIEALFGYESKLISD